MSRQLEQLAEERTAKRHKEIVRAVEFELVGALAAAGAEVQGFSVKMGDFECLMTVRATIGGVAMVAFIGAEDLGGAMIKLIRAARRDKLVWREDKYRANVG